MDHDQRGHIRNMYVKQQKLYILTSKGILKFLSLKKLPISQICLLGEKKKKNKTNLSALIISPYGGQYV